MSKKNYTLYLSSIDSGTGFNNNKTFNINWDSFLPREFNIYKMSFNFQTTSGYYKDTPGVTIYSNAKIMIDLQGRSFSYDTSNSGGSMVLGYANRESSTSSSATNSFNCFFEYNAPKTISRPNQNIINVKIYNMVTNLLLTDTNSNGSIPAADMTSWTMAISFEPIE